MNEITSVCMYITFQHSRHPNVVQLAVIWTGYISLESLICVHLIITFAFACKEMQIIFTMHIKHIYSYCSGTSQPSTTHTEAFQHTVFLLSISKTFKQKENDVFELNPPINVDHFNGIFCLVPTNIMLNLSSNSSSGGGGSLGAGGCLCP